MGLSESARETLGALLAAGQATRPQLSSATGLSRQTISVAAAELERGELIEPVGISQGHTGRTARVYALGRRSGWVLGLDVGSTHVHGLACSLDGAVLADDTYESRSASATRPRNMAGPAERLVSKRRGWLEENHGPLRGVAIALPVAVPDRRDPGSVRVLPPTMPGIPQLLDRMRLTADVPLLLENNVNCAALAERERGAARDCLDFVYVQVGVGIGAAIVAGGELIRGWQGSAGEIRRFPFPLVPGGKARRYELESFLSSAGLMARVRESWRSQRRPAPRRPADVFAEAAAGNPRAVAVVQEHASVLGEAVAGLASVLDPQLVVLGGGIGQSPMLLPAVREALDRLDLHADVTNGELGERATVEGAAVLAARFAVSELLNPDGSPPQAAEGLLALTR